MTPEERQAEALMRWLEAGGRGDPPEGADPDALAAVYALRPDLAPPPRVSIDDILGEVTAGPFADTVEDDDGGEVVPFPVPPSEPPPTDDLDDDDETVRRRPAWWGWAGASGLGALAAAAAALLVFTPDMEPQTVPALEQELDAAKVASEPTYERREGLLDRLTPRRDLRSRGAEDDAVADATSVAERLDEPMAEPEEEAPEAVSTRTVAAKSKDGSGGVAKPPPPPAVAAVPAEPIDRDQRAAGEVQNTYLPDDDAVAWGDDGLEVASEEADAYAPPPDAPAPSGADLPSDRLSAFGDLPDVGARGALQDEEATYQTALPELELAEAPASAQAPARKSAVSRQQRESLQALGYVEAETKTEGTALSASTRARLGDAARQAATDPLGAALALEPYIRAPKADGQAIALAAAEHALAARELDLAARLVAKGRALGPNVELDQAAANIDAAR